MRISDWSSDVCSSDLLGEGQIGDLDPAETDEHKEGNGERHLDQDGGARVTREARNRKAGAAAEAERRDHVHSSGGASEPVAKGWLRSTVVEDSVVDCGCPSIRHTGRMRSNVIDAL